MKKLTLIVGLVLMFNPIAEGRLHKCRLKTPCEQNKHDYVFGADSKYVPGTFGETFVKCSSCKDKDVLCWTICK